MTFVRDGATRSAVPAFTDIVSNLIVSNYEATAGCVDTDDGSSWLRVARNFCVYGGHSEGAAAGRGRAAGPLPAMRCYISRLPQSSGS